ncbi:MAG: START-like domain-containing protein [Prolixibacteraceae bacterium]|nr:START-like domain-containing protein [Prolixibacteraceae bacterium]
MTEKTKIQLEYIINCSPKMLYNRISSPSGLAEWFAEDVSIKGNEYTFRWKGAEEIAELVMQKENKLVRFVWADTQDCYFELKIIKHELTGDVALIVTDFPEEGETDEFIELWNNHINVLRHVVGA